MKISYNLTNILVVWFSILITVQTIVSFWITSVPNNMGLIIGLLGCIVNYGHLRYTEATADQAKVTSDNQLDDRITELSSKVSKLEVKHSDLAQSIVINSKPTRVL